MLQVESTYESSASLSGHDVVLTVTETAFNALPDRRCRAIPIDLLTQDGRHRFDAVRIALVDMWGEEVCARVLDPAERAVESALEKERPTFAFA